MSDRNTSTFYISNERSRENVRKFVEALPLVDEETKKPIAWRFLFKKVGQERSHAQNNALFGVAYPPLMVHMGLRGDREKRELHEFICGSYFGWVTVDYLGKKKQRPRRTVTTNEDGQHEPLTKKEFSDMFAFVQQLGAEHGVYIPDPDPLHWQNES